MAMAVKSISGAARTRPIPDRATSRIRFSLRVFFLAVKPSAKMSWLGLSSRTKSLPVVRS